jgi:hypothetical protein
MDDTSGNEQELELGLVRDSMTKSVVTLRPEQSLTTPTWSSSGPRSPVDRWSRTASWSGW